MLDPALSRSSIAAYGSTYPKKPIFGPFGPPASARFALEVSVVHYCRSKIQVCLICSKLKFLSLNNPFWIQNDQKRRNRTKIGDLLLINRRWFQGFKKSRVGYEVKVFCLWSDLDVFNHFGIRRYWFMNRILILSRSDKLKFSTSSSGRPNLLARSGPKRAGRMGRKLAFWGKWTQMQLG